MNGCKTFIGNSQTKKWLSFAFCELFLHASNIFVEHFFECIHIHGRLKVAGQCLLSIHEEVGVV